MMEPKTYLIEFKRWVFEFTVLEVYEGGAKVTTNELSGRPIPWRYMEQVYRALWTYGMAAFQEECGVRK